MAKKQVDKQEDNEVTVQVQKSEDQTEVVQNVNDGADPADVGAANDQGGDFDETVQANKEAKNPVELSNTDPTDPNGYNNAPHAAEGFIVNPVVGGGVPFVDDESVVNGITQLEGDDLPESNVDPEGVIEKLRKDAAKVLANSKKNAKSDK